MKKNYFLMRGGVVLAMMAAVFSFVACSDDDNGSAQPTTAEAEYTILMYGVGGGNLDTEINDNLNEVRQYVQTYGYSDKVRFRALMKWSKSYQNNPDSAGVRQLTLSADGLTDVKVNESDFRMDDPANIAAFIQQTVKELPAKSISWCLPTTGLE